MIRFCQKNTRKIKESEIHSLQNSEFFKQYENDGIIVVYEFEKVKGIITYQNFVDYEMSSMEVQLGKVIIGDSIWKQAHDLFDKNKDMVFLPVVDEKDEVICFCYDNRKKSYQYYEINTILDYYESDVENRFFIQDLYPQIKQIKIYGVNEWGYRLYKILRGRKIEVVVQGDFWEYFDVYSDPLWRNDYQVFFIYAEGKSQFYQADLFEQFNFLYFVAAQNMSLMYYSLREQYRELLENFYICQIPRFQDLERTSMNEKIRDGLGIDADLSKNSYGDIRKAQIKKVIGMEPEEFLKRKCMDDAVLDKISIGIHGINAKKIGYGKNRIYLMGPCIVEGMGVLLEDSLMSCIYRCVCREGWDYTIIAIAYELWDVRRFLEYMSNIPLTNKDIVFLIEENTGIENGNPDIDLLDKFNSRGLDEEWFYNIPIHSNRNGNEAIAAELVKHIKRGGGGMSEKPDNVVQVGRVLDSSGKRGVWEFIEKIKEQTGDIPQKSSIGAVVVNCNPFTLGHRYLIEYASQKVDFLFVFVLEEDVSFFSFEERYELVKKGVDDLKNVRVFPSGSFIISLHTFPAYFRKESYQKIDADACKDAEIFAYYLCPGLNIRMRFIGEEPVDETTRKYNKILHSTLENSGIVVHEIPRLEMAGEIISASKVRELYKKNDWKLIQNMVPESTYLFLRQRKGC